MSLLQKYNKNVPRYTSYPPVPYWTGAPEAKNWFIEIESLSSINEGVDLYLHIPYCHSPCYYCGCHKKVTKNQEKGTEYVDLLIKEWEIYLNQVPELKFNSIHFGGGTPTFLSAENLERLLAKLSPSFQDEFLGASEIDPRVTALDQLQVLRKYGFKRVSLGIQDFDSKVQKAINREQSFKLVSELVGEIRKVGFESVNFDLIFGLPEQTEETIKGTFEKVLELNPDLIAFYSYAHFPSIFPAQKLLDKFHLPVGDEKRKLYELGKNLLEDGEFIEIGLDHFARKGSYLADCYQSGRMQRSFMGYTDKKAPIMLGLGVSSISNSKNFYLQNTKDLKLYTEKIEAGELAIEKGHCMKEEDIIRSTIIQDLMCKGAVSHSDLTKMEGYEEASKSLAEFEQDQIITRSNDDIQITELGRKFLRNVASVFDEYYQLKGKKKVQFSRTI